MMNPMRVVASLAIIVAGGLEAGAAQAHFTPQITDLTVFKDGHVLVLSRGTATLEDGWCRTRAVPVPVLGTFWTFVGEKGARVDFVKAGFAETTEMRPCLSFDEIVRANVGRQAVIVEQPKDAPPITHKGTLRGILEHTAPREADVTRTRPARWDRFRGHIPAARTRETRLDEASSLSSFLMLETEAGLQLIQRAYVRSISLAGKDPVTVRAEKKKVREIALRVVSNGKPLGGKHEIGMVYLQKGIRWIPNYHIELLDGGKAKLTLQGTVINDLADLENVHLRLVVGVPSFLMKDSLSPVALREVGLQLSSYFRPPDRGGVSRQTYVLSNAMMSQIAAPVTPREVRGGGGPDIPSEGQREDLFLYHREGVSLKKGERAVVHLLEITVPYEDIYAWDIPAIPPRDLWGHVGRDQQRRLARAYTGARAIHKIRLTNAGSTPWTTGPAAIFRGPTPLGQQLLTYTSVKNKVDVPITIATDLNTSKEEVEVRRQHNALKIGSTSYTKVTLKGKLTVTNFKAKAVRLVVKRQVVGAVASASNDGKIRRANPLEDAVADLGGLQWYSWGWPWWYLSLNPFSEIVWEATVPKGKSVTFAYDYSYYYRR